MALPINLHFQHGLGDCANFAHVLQLYRRRGYEFYIRSDASKSLIWEAAGARASIPTRSIRHFWPHPPGFNKPEIEDEVHSSKIGWNISRPPLPIIGDPRQLWEELCDVNLAEVLDPLLDPEDSRKASTFLKHLPRPVILLHTAGNTSPEVKSLPDELVNALYRALLADFSGSIVLLDWDDRVPRVAHGRVRHLKADWGEVGLGALAALMRESALLIGIDSGPYYFASLTRIPALGVFHHHYPSCVALPRANNVNMVRAAFGSVNAARRARWNIVEYDGNFPSAGEIARHACRMLAAPRYRLPLGRDVMLQQWIRDWSYAMSPAFPIADRNCTLDFLMREISERFAAPQIVATGCIRSSEDWKNGYATYLFGAYLEGRRTGHLIVVDDNRETCLRARAATSLWSAYTTILCTDPISWLREHSGTVDVLYLNSLQTESSARAEHALREVQAAEERLSKGAVIAIDDSPWLGGWTGRGARAVPYLLDRGWQILSTGFQTILALRVDAGRYG